jgi:hypothetical protein
MLRWLTAMRATSPACRACSRPQEELAPGPVDGPHHDLLVQSVATQLLLNPAAGLTFATHRSRHIPFLIRIDFNDKVN